ERPEEDDRDEPGQESDQGGVQQRPTDDAKIDRRGLREQGSEQPARLARRVGPWIGRHHGHDLRAFGPEEKRAGRPPACHGWPMISISGGGYAVPRRKPVIFGVEGCAPESLDRALEDGLMPRLRRALDDGGLYARGLGQMPSFTNPNNVSIVTGVTPAVHGIS